MMVVEENERRQSMWRTKIRIDEQEIGTRNRYYI